MGPGSLAQDMRCDNAMKRSAPAPLAALTVTLAALTFACDGDLDSPCEEGLDGPDCAARFVEQDCADSREDGTQCESEAARSECANGDCGATCDAVDILVVVDNSDSMADEQFRLATNANLLVGAFDELVVDGIVGNYRMGLTTTGVSKSYGIPVFPGLPPLPFSQYGDNGVLLRECAPDDYRPWIDGADGDREQRLQCELQVGTYGPNIEMPLEAVRLALSEELSYGANAGFLRNDSMLIVVLVTDEDDCSRSDDDYTLRSEQDCDPEPVAAYARLLEELRGPDGFAIHTIAGPGAGVCAPEASEATRLRDFGDSVVHQGFSPICWSVESIADQVATTVQNACAPTGL